MKVTYNRFEGVKEKETTKQHIKDIESYESVLEKKY